MKRIQVKPTVSTITKKYESQKLKRTRKSTKSTTSEKPSPAVQSDEKSNIPPEIPNQSIILEVAKDYNDFTKDPIERPPSYQSHIEENSHFAVQPNGSVRGLWQEFRADTTMHGLKHASQIKKYKLRGTIWAIALCAMLSLLIYTTYDLFYKYSQKTTISNVQMEIVDELPFPSITFCNLSPYKKSSLPEDPKIHDYFLRTSRLEALMPPINYSDPNWSILQNPIEEGWLQDVSFTIEDLFGFCVLMNDIMAECSDILVPKVTSWGLCYTFNDYQKVLQNGQLMTSSTGSASAFTMYLTVRQSEYVHSKNLAAGMKIIIHDPEEEPDVENMGFFASPGFSSYASVQFSKHKYLPYPYQSIGGGYCLDTKANDFQNPLKYHETYSRTACLLECRLQFLISKCDCKAPTDFGNYTICSLATLATCYNGWKEYYMKNKTLQAACVCRQPCEYNLYSTTVSTGYFTADIYIKILEMMGFTELRKNYLEVRIFFDNLSFLKVENIAEYNLEKIVGALGGQMGIFLGASLLTLSELIEFLILTGVVLCKKIFSRQKN